MTNLRHPSPSPALVSAAHLPSANTLAALEHPGTTDPPGAVPLGAFLADTAAVLRAGWPTMIWVEATCIKAAAASYGHALELIDPGPGGAKVGQMRVFLPGSALPEIRRDLGVEFDPAQLVGLTIVLRLAPDFDPKWHLQGRILGLARAMQASLAARVLADVRARLRREGLLDRQRRLPHPRDVTRIAVERELTDWQRAGILHVRFIPAPFDGPGAALRLAEVVRRAAEPIAGFSPDLLVVARGGGARSGLLALDDEGLARTVATLPVPVVTGLGHASDHSLLDEVVGPRSAHTPSKALGVVRDLLGGTARRALADLSLIRLTASGHLESAAGDLDLQHQRVLAGAERVIAAHAADVAACWGEVRTRVAEAGAQLDRAGTELDHRLEQITAVLPLTLERAAAEGDRLLREITEAARRCVAATPDSDTPLGAILTRAASLIATAERDGDRLIDAVTAGALRHLDHHDALLRQAENGLADVDHEAVLGRGYLLAHDAIGRVLTTRAAAMAARTFTLTFGDGTLAVVAVDPRPASRPGA